MVRLRNGLRATIVFRRGSQHNPRANSRIKNHG
jgi:hypothetical protein